MASVSPQRPAFVRKALVSPASPPPESGLAWVRRRLLSGWQGVILTALALVLLWSILPPVLDFLVFDAVWRGEGREACVATASGRPPGACWPFIQAKLGQFVYGFYPAAERWRVDVVFALAAALLIPLLTPALGYKRLNAVLLFAVFPVLAAGLLTGGVFDLVAVPTSAWGGLLVTLVVSATGIVVSLPLGILLALGRRSKAPVVSAFCVVFIEFWRGVPLITVLFFAAYMLPLFLPNAWSIDAFVRALAGVAIFASAYMAEVIRGGLQAVPAGQSEAARALGLGPWRALRLVMLPQALRFVIPGIVNTFIGLFKDTTLVMTVAIFDLLGQLRAAFADPNWAAPQTLFTGFAFAGFVYFAFCFGMSRYALFVERRLAAAQDRG